VVGDGAWQKRTLNGLDLVDTLPMRATGRPEVVLAAGDGLFLPEREEATFFGMH
jgi:hypothetical protein